ncbi:hypothetical protein JZ751_013319 [Albula glossodonta]|uniref:Uncharacterized protein n=1 Tax=Albula glossodonta TaxID=121402 RepID=A0A8T2NXS5_9TELE|nr:hypothetical protein JZ751_013319 [Albula glossodonta]
MCFFLNISALASNRPEVFINRTYLWIETNMRFIDLVFALSAARRGRGCVEGVAVKPESVSRGDVSFQAAEMVTPGGVIRPVKPDARTASGVHTEKPGAFSIRFWPKNLGSGVTAPAPL